MKDNFETVEKHIDMPMRKIVAGLNLLGFKTLMSCCGYTYEGEEVKKSHLGKAYVYLDNRVIPDASMFLTLLANARWQIKFEGPYFIDLFANTWENNHPWGSSDSVHNYEVYVLAINQLEKTLERDYFIDKMRDYAVIADGNHHYITEDEIKYWQYKPALDWVVTKEQFLAM